MEGVRKYCVRVWENCKCCLCVCCCCCSIMMMSQLFIDKRIAKFNEHVRRLRTTHDMLSSDAENIINGRYELCFDPDMGSLAIYSRVKDWLREADNVLDKARKLETDIEKNMRCLTRLLHLRHQFGYFCKIHNMISEIKHVVNDSMSMNIDRSTPERFFLSGSFNSAFKRMVEALESDDVNMIAVLGMAGVGKTTLIKRVVKETSFFSKVIVVPVSQTPNIENIQDRIAAILELKMGGSEMGSREEQLRLSLEKENKLLIVLDDVWDRLNLKAIGIPHDRGCKIIFTTRLQQVCNSMGVQQVIPLDILNDHEAYDFMKGETRSGHIDDELVKECEGLPLAMVDLGGHQYLQSPTSNYFLKGETRSGHIDDELVKECESLPLAMVDLGGHQYLQSPTSNEARYAIQSWCMELRKPKFLNGESLEALKNTCLAIRLSYDSLEESTTQKCFLLCSLLFPRDSAIDVEVLTRYACGMQLYEGIHSVNKVRCTVKTEITTLISSSLLLHHKREGVKMHKLVCYCALWIASQEKVPFMMELDQSGPEDENLENVSERYVGDENLEILLLDGGDIQSRIISLSALLERLKSLKAFTLQDGHLSVGSLEALTSLRSLNLVRCQIDDISSLGKLQKLEILSFHGSDISELPDEIAELNHLRWLDLWDCQKLQKIPLNLLRKLSQLEELCFNFLSLEEWWFEETGIEGSRGSSSEIHRSSTLSNILQTYKIAIDIDASYEYPNSRILRVTAFSSNLELFPAVECLHLLSSTDSHCNEPTLQLSNSTCMDLIEFPNLSCIWNGPPHHVNPLNLKVLTLKDCNELISLFSISMAKRMVYLEKLEINGCKELEEIITEELYDGYADMSFSSTAYPLCLGRLKTVEINKCGKLKNVLRITTASVAPWLSELKISDCPKLTRLFEVQNDLVVLHELKKLSLQRLLALTTFCSEEFSIGLPFLETLEVGACPLFTNDIYEIIKRDQLKDISFIAVGKELYEEIFQLQVGYFLSSLEKMVLEELQDLKVIWKDPSQIISLQNLTILKVVRCNKLKNVFSVQLARNLPQLSHLEVIECEEMEQVISKDQKASSMATHKPVYFPKLEVIRVMKCNKLKYLFPLTVSSLPKLKKLLVEEAFNLIQIFEHEIEENIKNDEQEVKLPALEELSLQRLDNFMAFSSVGYNFVFPSLHSLDVIECPRRIMDFFDDWGHNHVGTKIEIDNRESYFRRKIGASVNEDIRVKYKRTSKR